MHFEYFMYTRRIDVLVFSILESCIFTMASTGFDNSLSGIQ